MARIAFKRIWPVSGRVLQYSQGVSYDGMARPTNLATQAIDYTPASLDGLHLTESTAQCPGLWGSGSICPCLVGHVVIWFSVYIHTSHALALVTGPRGQERHDPTKPTRPPLHGSSKTVQMSQGDDHPHCNLGCCGDL